MVIIKAIYLIYNLGKLTKFYITENITVKIFTRFINNMLFNNTIIYIIIINRIHSPEHVLAILTK